MAKVLVLGEDARIVLPIYRSLGRCGIQVHATWCPAGSPALRSRYASRVHRLAEYSTVSSQWLDELSQLLSTERMDLVIPATEAAAYSLHQHRAELEDAPGIHFLEREAFEVVYDKARTYALARQLNIPYPRTAHLRHVDDVDGQLQQLRAPYVIKPICSVNAAEVTAKNYVHLYRDVETTNELCRQWLASGVQVLVQETFEGTGYGVEILAYEGEVLFAFGHRRLHETSGFGSTYRQSVSLDERLLEAAKLLMKQLNYTGVAMVEFRVNETSSDWVLMEVNGRFWGSLPLAVAAGADFPRFLYEMLIQGRRNYPQDYRVGVRCRDLLNDCRWMWRSFRGSRRAAGKEHMEGWEMNPISRSQFLRDLARMLSLRDHADLFTWSDPAPAVAEIASLLKIAKGKWTKLFRANDCARASGGGECVPVRSP